MTEREERRFNYFAAKSQCKHGCICHNGIYKISNVDWEQMQGEYYEATKLASQIELDEKMKKELFATLKSKVMDIGGTLQTTETRLPLKYQIVHVDKEKNKVQVHDLCDDCWVNFHNHRCE